MFVVGFFLCSSRRRHTRCALVTGVQTCALPICPATRHDGASIDDRLDPAVRPNVVLMNPPFSAVANVGRTMRDAALRHIGSALARLADGGRRSEEHTSELQSLMRISYAVFSLKKKKPHNLRHIDQRRHTMTT